MKSAKCVNSFFLPPSKNKRYTSIDWKTKSFWFGDFFFLLFWQKNVFFCQQENSSMCCWKFMEKRESFYFKSCFGMFEKSFHLVFFWEIFILLEVIKLRKVEVFLSSTSAGGSWKHHYFQNIDGISFRPKFHVSSIWQAGEWALSCDTSALCGSRPLYFPWLLHTPKLLQLDKTQHPSFHSSGKQISG